MKNVPDLLQHMPERMARMFWGGLLGALILSVFLVVPAMAAEPAEPVLLWPERHGRDGKMLPVQGPWQGFSGDMTIERGQTIDDDVFVSSGNVDVEEGGRITGDLVVFSGNIEIEEGAEVEGDVTNSSGNIVVGGRVGGDVAAFSGDIELESSAVVGGDITVLSGNIEREEGATVGGNVVQGPSFRFPRAGAPDAPRAPAGIVVRDEGPGFFGTILNLIGRLFVAALMTALVMLLVGALFYAKPELIANTRRRLNEKLALSAVVGVLVNLTMLFLGGLLAVTICLLPLALVPLLILLALNVVGWTVASQIVGERLVKIAKQEVQPALTILVGAFFLTGIVALLWALGGCFRPLGYLLALAASSVGTGAALLPWLNRRRGLGGISGGGGDIPPGGPTPAGPAPAGSGAAFDEGIETDVAAPLDYVTAEEINAGARRSAGVQSFATSDAQGIPSAEGDSETTGEIVEQDVAAPIDYFTAGEINASAETKAAAPKSRSRAGKKASEANSPSPAVTEEETVELDEAAPIDYVTAQEVNTTETLGEGDDFLRIRGVGPTYARRLKDAGFATFAQLAAASPEEVAAAIGWPAGRVRRAEVIDQAKVLAQ